MAWADEGPGQFQLLPDLSGLTSGAPDANLQVTARVRMAVNSRIGMLEVTATMNGATLTAKLVEPLEAIRWVGHSVTSVTTDFSPIEISTE